MSKAGRFEYQIQNLIFIYYLHLFQLVNYNYSYLCTINLKRYGKRGF